MYHLADSKSQNNKFSEDIKCRNGGMAFGVRMASGQRLLRICQLKGDRVNCYIVMPWDVPSGHDDIVRDHRRSKVPNERHYVFRIGFIDDSDYSLIVAFASSAMNVHRHGIGRPQGLFSTVQKAFLSVKLHL